MPSEKTSKAIVELLIRPRPDDPKRVPRAAALALVRSLADGDKLSLVVFASRAELLQPAAELDAEIRAAIGNPPGVFVIGVQV